MIINCPHCGPRDLIEFSYAGDAENALSRPQPSQTDQAVWNSYVYDRPNPAGAHSEIWQHSGGCRSHMKVLRNTLTHTITGVALLGRGGKP